MALDTDKIQVETKRFETLNEIIVDEFFIEQVGVILSNLRKERIHRKPAKAGFRYKRDWYDRMAPHGQVTADFFINNALAIWEKRSPLNSETRAVIANVCGKAFELTIQHYTTISQSK